MSSSASFAGSGLSPGEIRLLQGLLSALNDPAMVFDAEGRCLWASRGVPESFGLAREEMEGRRRQDLVADALTRRIFQDCWDAVLECREPVREEMAQAGPGTESRHFDITLSPINGEDGRLRAMVLVTRDLTRRKAMEDALRRTEEQLRHMQKVDALGQLVGGIAHDFNNLMTVVNGYSDMLLQILPGVAASEEPESARALVQEIRKAGQKACMLTQQLLAFGRKQASMPKVLDMNQVVLDMERMLRRSLTGPFDLTVDLAREAGPVFCDPGQVGQVLMNLVLNARDALPRGGRISIRTAEADISGNEGDLFLIPSAGRYASLSVEDNGIGIGPEIRERLFEPFFSTKEKGKGTGLGLSTVYGIVKDAGGGIGLESRPRHGSRFTIYLPRADRPVPGDQAAAEPAGRITGPGSSRLACWPSGSKAHSILLVEDEEPVRRLVAGILTGEGYSVAQADSGSEALRIFTSLGGELDLVISDIVMPGMSGRELIQCLQAMRPGLKVICMSGYVDDEAFVEGLGEGSTPFLAKPFSPADLSAKVREALETEARGIRKTKP